MYLNLYFWLQNTMLTPVLFNGVRMLIDLDQCELRLRAYLMAGAIPPSLADWNDG
jgi:hypothetical protein